MRDNCETRQVCKNCTHYWSGVHGYPVCNNHAAGRNRWRKKENDYCGLWEIGYDEERRGHRDFAPEYEQSLDNYCR